MTSSPTPPPSFVESLFSALVEKRKVVVADVPAAIPPTPEPLEWFASTLDLHMGLLVDEIPTDTLPDDLRDSLFGT